ncbi:PREDICTED: leupaxin isoform X1 [Miniopterus natalensis]|uniref:leupaxin isoform X1 n=1 Tax=Miniopterus natalensis TaxID=291302 RepID=UPI0007A723A3|nr:PREDICTED: leupaxin isoform X1 [Miniopterus natalensis]
MQRSVCKPSPSTDQSSSSHLVAPEHLGCEAMEELDALLEELERSTLQDGSEPSSPAPLPVGPPSSKDSGRAETAGSPSVQDDTSPLQVQLVYTTDIKGPHVYSDIQEPKESPPPSKTSAAAQLDELMAHLCDMQAKVAVKVDANKKYLPDKQEHKDSLDSMLGGLEQELQDLGITTVSKGHCASCQKPIAGKVIHALGQSWHPEHFICSHCKEEIGASPFFERSGLAYCPKDYHHLFSPRCAYCAAPILDKVLTAMNQTWHPEHFFCFHCGEVFGAEGFHEKDQKPYCRKDFLAMFSPKCGGCNRPVLENYLSAMDTVWHPECFVCGDCFSSFSTGSFFELDGRPFCELHYHQRRGTLCHGCGQPISGRCISAMGHKFHPEHFVCAFCLAQLSKGIFREQNGKTYCPSCFNKLFQP